ncbi:hypothetical protein ACOHX9_000808 [Yersinia enterocolitica]|uniref:hypothetical protein n=1 Tax=Enterobacterales TaxID=91347 RepID=UPI002A54E020|nr:hypothetical protein [Yersinia enterocolitica]EKN5979261.1 hypothetical protein [Yersinia enterocolitica]ELZ0585638.1 hypothetical protein [Yersinia enterocolitica]HDL7937317.1 hypothetical protein [Yersinia enterocolitica]HDL7938202.1 hypothetical protein [Yersinia enterocolitica]
MPGKHLIPIYPHLGADSLRKLRLIASKHYPGWIKEEKKSGEALNMTLSYCIEVAYNLLEKSRTSPPLYDALPPPETVKAQILYDIYQRITTLKGNGSTTAQTVAYLNQSQSPTPDDLFAGKPLTAATLKPSRWNIRDVNAIITRNGQPTELLREHLLELNQRGQRKRVQGAKSVR